MTDIDLAALRAAAEAATPGPWEVCTPHDFAPMDDFLVRTVARDWMTGPVEIIPGGGEMGDDGLPLANATYIAAANPAVVLALLDELEALRAAVRTHREPTPQQWDAYGSSVRDMPDPYRDEAAIRRALEAPPATPYIPPSLKRTLARNHEEQS